jgi:hypothetical protein
MGKGLPEFYSSVLWKTEFDVVVWFLAFNCQI